MRRLETDYRFITKDDGVTIPVQYDAFKLALTKEFAIIQGPPGTGKTYVGLKIVETLLYNLYEVPHREKLQSSKYQL
ncbi:hypothetical protein EB796_019953 [Bugula neritina]|uniref:DNA2/NAM7 helicase helicase domain-containing protein n=1 Tax=Bugula neritina TaxID=10212 RepID=A0A7J7J832_BUGNE|nr:hypothetical protein EB796_019953 [Bugula neritina]